MKTIDGPNGLFVRVEQNDMIRWMGRPFEWGLFRRVMGLTVRIDHGYAETVEDAERHARIFMEREAMP